MDKYPYKVYDQKGNTASQREEAYRHDRKTELSILNAGYTIKLHGKRITKKEVK